MSQEYKNTCGTKTRTELEKEIREGYFYNQNEPKNQDRFILGQIENYNLNYALTKSPNKNQRPFQFRSEWVGVL